MDILSMSLLELMDQYLALFGRVGYFGEDFGPYRLLNLDSSQVDRLTYMAISLDEALTAWAELGNKIGVETVPTS